MGQKIIVALYDHFSDARAAVSDIMQAGVPGDAIAMLANDSNGDHPGLTINPAYAREQFDEDSTKQSRFVTLGEVGIGLGGILGFLANISPIAIPGIAGHPFWMPIVGGAVICGIIGVIIGLVTDHGVSGADTELYSEGLKRGGTLVRARVDESMAGKAAELLKRHNAVKVEDRAPDWTAEGWVSLDVGHAEMPAGLATA
ncbi:MAG: hypothetical protein JWM91_2880 [Rhodospirillales bacterium]|jgi:hypothetical protein|nr:hypothetical protein [Rhodospirillales bacterium]